MVTRNQITVKTYKTAQVPFEFVHAQMFSADTKTGNKPSLIQWSDGKGNKSEVLARGTLTPYDLVNFLTFLYVAQRADTEKREYTRLEDPNKIPTITERVEVRLNMKSFYDILKLPRNGSNRQNLMDSIAKLSKVSIDMEFAEPENHGGLERLVMTGLIGDIEWHKQPGKPSILIAHPLKSMILDPAYTVNLTDIIALTSDIGKLITFHMARCPHLKLTVPQWQMLLGHGKSLRHFRRHFNQALKELEKSGKFLIEKIGDEINVKRLSSNLYSHLLLPAKA